MTLRPDRNPSDRHSDLLLDELEVATGLFGEVVVATDVGDPDVPTLEVLVDRCAVVEHRLLAGKVLMTFSAEVVILGFVGNGDLQLLEVGENVEFGDEELGESVDPRRVSQRHQVEPPAPAGGGP